MEESKVFTVETLYDPVLWHEYHMGYRNTDVFSTVRGCVSIAGFSCLLFCFLQGELFAYTFLICAVPILLHRLIYALSAEKGDSQYRKFLRQNGGKIPHQVITVGNEELILMDQETRKEKHFDYSEIRNIIETQNLLILILKPKAAIVLEKRWLRGGTVEDLKNFLLNRCPQSCSRVRTGKVGRALGIMLTVLLLLGSVCAVQKIASSAMPVGKLRSDMSCAEILTELEPLGITCEDEGILSELDEYEFRSGSEKVFSLLCWLGYGEYDFDTWEWSPAENGVYWFDAEFIAVDCMYSDFLRGVSALGNGELDFTNVREDHTNVDWYQGTGTVTICFDWKGTNYQTGAVMMQDWFDVSVLETLCRIVGENGDKNLYFAFDGGQGYLVFYGDRQWAAEFMSLTGIALETR